MELSLRRFITEKWEVSNCPNCDVEPELLEWVDTHNSQRRHIDIRCPECHRQASSQTYLYHNTDTISHANDRYHATVLSIRDWENLS